MIKWTGARGGEKKIFYYLCNNNKEGNTARWGWGGKKEGRQKLDWKGKSRTMDR